MLTLLVTTKSMDVSIQLTDMAITILLVCVGIIVLWNFFSGKEKKKDKMWEILVPASSKMQEFTYDHHKIWDEFVVQLAGGLTILKTAKGEWTSPDNVRFKDRMIPVRIKCSKKQIKKIIDFTIKHYNQEAVLAYKVSSDVLLINRNQVENDGKQGN